ncbi:MAG: hypothetical protein Q9182_006473 [Xanthomendoza sp. 2 TL-2023]
MPLRWPLTLLLLTPFLIQALSFNKPKTDINVQQDDDVCLTFKACSENGYRYWNKLHTTLELSQQGKFVDRNNSELFQEHYFAEYDTTMVADPDLVQSFSKRQLDPSFLDYWEISGFDPVTLRRDRMPAYYDIFDTHGGVIVAHGNQRRWDSQKAIPWSEIMYQTWQLAEQKANKLGGKNHPHGGPISNLRSVVQHVIHNKGTQAVMKTAYEANGFVPGYDGPEEWRKWTEEDNKHFFFGFLGTDNIKGTIWLLNDHANELGRKQISAIWTRWHLGNPDIWYINLHLFTITML